MYEQKHPDGCFSLLVPDVVFDHLLTRLGEAELKALLYIIRRTFGFKKDRDPVSFNQFLRGIITKDGEVQDEGCGIRDRTTLCGAEIRPSPKAACSMPSLLLPGSGRWAN
jgi:hypothetical protein